jgi:hypothetical protein
VDAVGQPDDGHVHLKFWDGTQTITVTGVANTVTAAALDTSIEAALTAAGYTGGPVTVAGGPLNTTPITITFNGTQTAARPFATLTKANDTTSPAVTITNTTPGVRNKHTFNPSATQGFWATFVRRSARARARHS